MRTLQSQTIQPSNSDGLSRLRQSWKPTQTATNGNATMPMPAQTSAKTNVSNHSKIKRNIFINRSNLLFSSHVSRAKQNQPTTSPQEKPASLTIKSREMRLKASRCNPQNLAFNQVHSLISQTCWFSSLRHLSRHGFRFLAYFGCIVFC